MIGIGAFRVFMRTSLILHKKKPAKVGFILNKPNSLSRAEDLAAVNRM